MIKSTFGIKRLLPITIITIVSVMNFNCSGNNVSDNPKLMKERVDSISATFTGADSNYYQKSLLLIEGDSITTTLSEVNANAYVTKKAIKPTEWHHVENLYVEGTHGRLGGRTETKKRFTLNDPKFKFEWGQEVLKKDDDAGWSFNAFTESDIEWTVWAQNCLHSCDEITLQIKYRVVPK